MLRIDGFHIAQTNLALLSLNRDLASPYLSSLGIAQTSLALLSLNRDFSLLKDSDFVERHIGRKLVLQAIDVDELAVEFFLVLV